jgi:hypothetical protein
MLLDTQKDLLSTHDSRMINLSKDLTGRNAAGVHGYDAPGEQREHVYALQAPAEALLCQAALAALFLFPLLWKGGSNPQRIEDSMR